jgi:hypothetical protein
LTEFGWRGAGNVARKHLPSFSAGRPGSGCGGGADDGATGAKEFETLVRAKLPLESAGEALRIAASDMTSGKVFFTPNAASR